MAFLRKQKRLLLQIFSLFSLVRGYNIALLILSQYFTARYILAFEKNWNTLLLDVSLFCIVAASATSSAAGYIINSFYDAQKDRINRPVKFLLEHLVSQQMRLFLYLILNMITLTLASVVSFKAVLFFSVYIVSIWLYSSSLKRLFWISNLFSAALMILPFWVITLYFKNFDSVIFYHAAFLFVLILIRDIVKDMESYKGDWVHQYQTLPIVFGHTITKQIIGLLIISGFLPAYFLIQQPLGLMDYYFILSVPFLLFLLALLWKAKNQKAFLRLHNFIKLWIFIGILSIALIYKDLTDLKLYLE